MKYLKIFSVVFVVIIFSLFFTSSCKRIDAGNVGLVVKLFGSAKGVQDVTEVTGMVWYNPFTTEVYQFPTFVQNVVYTKDSNEGSPSNEEFRVTTEDGLVVTFDVSMNYRVDPTKVPAIFKKYRKPLHDLDKTVMRNYMRDAYNRISGQYTAEELYTNKNKFQNETGELIQKSLGKEGFIVEQVVLLNELRLPPSVVENINAKINASQIAEKKRQEIMQEEAEAQKAIAQSKGYAESIRIKSEAEANANRIVAQSLSPALIEYEKVKKWNGQNPTTVLGNTSTVMQLK